MRKRDLDTTDSVVESQIMTSMHQVRHTPESRPAELEVKLTVVDNNGFEIVPNRWFTSSTGVWKDFVIDKKL